MTGSRMVLWLLRRWRRGDGSPWLWTLWLVVLVLLLVVSARWEAGVREGLHRIDPAVDVVIAPKRSPVGLLRGLFWGGPWEEAWIRLDTGRHSLDREVRPEHAIPVAVITHLDGGVLLAGTSEAFWTRPASLWAPSLARGSWPGVNEVVLGAAAAKRLRLSVGDTLDVFLARPSAGGVAWQARLVVSGVLDASGGAWSESAWTTLDVAHDAYAALLAEGGVAARPSTLISHWLVALGDDPAVQARLFDTFHVRRAELVLDVASALDQLGDEVLVSGPTRRSTQAVALLLLVLFVVLRVQMRGEVWRREQDLWRACGWSPGARVGLLWADTALPTAFAFAAGLLASLVLEQPLWVADPRWSVPPWSPTLVSSLAWLVGLWSVSGAYALMLLRAPPRG